MKKTKIIFYVVILLLLAVIGFRYSGLENESHNLAGEIEMVGKVSAEPDVRDNNTKLTIESARERASYKFLATVNKYPEYKYGDVLQIKGKLQEPPVFEDFNYKDYLKALGINYVMHYPKIELLSRGRPSASLYEALRAGTSALFWVKNKLRENIYRNLPPPQSYLLGALILGDKNRISNNFKEELNIAGIRHLTAVSGMHIVIVSSIILSLFLFLGFWKKQAIMLSLLFIFFFIALTGFQTSSIRAGVMGSLFLIGPLFGRKSDSSRALILAGLAMLAINPFLFKEAGFQLSFSAALGIILLSSTFKKYLRSDILAVTFSAYVFTMPILIYSFGKISLIGPLTNLLVLPVVPILMILGFIASVAGWQLLFFPPWFLLAYIAKITEIFSKPYFAQEFINIHWIWIITVYFLLIPSAWYFKKKESRV